jgi:hypothetical protein
MMKKPLLLFLFFCFAGLAHGQTVQCQTTAGAWGPCPLNASIQLFTTVTATATHTATKTRVYNNVMTGSLVATWASITGSPATCTFQVESGDSLGNVINNGPTISVTPSNGTTSTTFVGVPGQRWADEITVVYACGTYPTAGTLSLEYVPATVDNGGSHNECAIVSAASTNSTSCKGSAGDVWGYELYNTTTTIYYLRLYNASSAPTCSSATGFIKSIPVIPAAASGGSGGQISNEVLPVPYATGIGFCLTGGSSSTDNTNAAVGIFGVVKYR